MFYFKQIIVQLRLTFSINRALHGNISSDRMTTISDNKPRQII